MVKNRKKCSHQRVPLDVGQSDIERKPNTILEHTQKDAKELKSQLKASQKEFEELEKDPVDISDDVDSQKPELCEQLPKIEKLCLSVENSPRVVSVFKDTEGNDVILTNVPGDEKKSFGTFEFANDDKSPRKCETGERELLPIKPYVKRLMPSYLDRRSRQKYLKDMVNSLPEDTQNRITVLKNQHLDMLQVHKTFNDELWQIKMKYQEKFNSIYKQRRQILNTDDEHTMASSPDEIRGFPNFWYNTFVNTILLASLIQEQDKPALRLLKDVQILYQDKRTAFTLFFEFGVNPFFNETVLTKKYYIRNDIPKENPFKYKGQQIVNCKGCNISWKKGMDLTKKKIVKVQRHKDSGKLRDIIELIPRDSFFDFFKPPEKPRIKDKPLTEEQKYDMEILSYDFLVGQFICDELIPKAILFYTGEKLCDSDQEESLSENSTNPETTVDISSAKTSEDGEDDEEVEIKEKCEGHEENLKDINCLMQ